MSPGLIGNIRPALAGKVRRRLIRLASAGAVLAITGSLTAGHATAFAADAPAAAAKTNFTTAMRLTRSGGCPLYAGLLGTTQPLTANAWHHSQGYRVGWRYRVNKTWSLVLDYGRGDVAHKPRWGFVETSCLKGNHYPAAAKDGHGHIRNLWSKGSHHWRHVIFGTSPAAGAHTIGTREVVVAYTTMRDKPRAFAIGNLFAKERFKITSRCTSHHNDSQDHSPWIYGQDLQSGRWGWVPSGALHGNPCV